MTKLDLKKAETMTSAEIGRHLRDREKKFGEEFLKDRNATHAAIRAGYKPGKNGASARVQGYRLLRNETVRAYRLALIRENFADYDVSRESVLIKYLSIYDKAMTDDDYRGACKALEGLSKLMGYDAPEKQSDSEGTGVIMMAEADEGDE